MISRKKCGMAFAMILGLGILAIDANAAPIDTGTTKIHFISLYGNSDAILLESNGHYGMIDSGEDWDYPTGEDERYPLRAGTTKNIGYEQQVIHYLKQMGVEKLDFYLGTHAHSDHIGSGDEILNHFRVKRLYIGEYDDSYQLDSYGDKPDSKYYYPEAQENKLWDNQYVYDNLINAAKQNGVRIITNTEMEKFPLLRKIKLGDMDITVMNYERARDEDGNIIPVASENENSLVVRISAYGKNAVLTGDLDPTDGASQKVADQLVDELWDSAGVSDDKADEIENNNYDVDYTLQEETDEEASYVPNEIALQNVEDESVPNQGKKIELDLMKMAHHSIDYNNTTYFLTSLNPKTVVITGRMEYFNERMQECLPNTEVYATKTDSAAVIAEFTDEVLTTTYEKIEPEWNEIDGEEYYFDSNGRTMSGWQEIDGKTYLFNYKGVMQTGWQKLDGKWYYLAESGAMQTGWQKIDGKWYYLNTSGVMQTGWQKVDGKWYYLNTSGVMQMGWQKIDGRWYYLNTSGVMQMGWQKIDGRWYYLNTSGVMQTGWQKVDGKWYYLNTSGAMQTSWQKVNGKWYYLNTSGVMQTGWQKINGKKYYFNASGVWIK